MSCKCNSGLCSTSSKIKTKTITYEIKEEDLFIMKQLEKYFYEYNGLLQLVTQFTSTSPFKPDDERYNVILNEYMERFIQYNLLFDEIVQMACEDLYINRLDIINQSLSFIEEILYLEIKED